MPEVGDTRDVWLDDQHEISMTFCWIPPGEFRMGSRYSRPMEQPVHRVIMPRNFWLAETPVTQGQYACFDPDHRSESHGKPNHPVERIKFCQSREFCFWLKQARANWPWPTELSGFEPDIPTETQWEYACRAGTETEFYTGDGQQAASKAGWYDEDPGTKCNTNPVGQKAPNIFGLYDMHGNIWEWCRDLRSESGYRHYLDGRIEPVTAADYIAQIDDAARAARGGARTLAFMDCQSARRNFIDSFDAFDLLGFRVGLFPGPSCPTK